MYSCKSSGKGTKEKHEADDCLLRQHSRHRGSRYMEFILIEVSAFYWHRRMQITQELLTR